MSQKTIGQVLSDLETHVTTRPGRQFMQNVRTLHGAIKQAEREGKPSEYINRLRAEGRAAVTASLRDDQTAERERLGVELQKERERYEASVERDLAKIDIRVRNQERRFSAMSDKELTAMVASPPTDAWTFDAFSAELAGRGLVNEHDAVRALGAKGRVHEPWRRSENGAAADRELALNANVSGTGVMLDFGDGKTGATDFDSVWHLVEESAKEAGDAR
jgi:hypothetical protein